MDVTFEKDSEYRNSIFEVARDFAYPSPIYETPFIERARVRVP